MKLQGDTEVVLAICFFFFGMLTFHTISNEGASIPIMDLLPAATTLIASFTGAYLAFSFDQKKLKEQEYRNNARCINRAIIAINRIRSQLITHQKQVLEPSKDDDLRHLTILPSGTQDMREITIDIDSIAFLAESSRPNIINQLCVFDDTTKMLFNNINARDLMHHNKVQDALEEHDDLTLQKATPSELKKMIGHATWDRMKSMTDGIIDLTPTQIVAAGKLVQELSELSEQFCYGQNIIEITYDEL